MARKSSRQKEYEQALCRVLNSNDGKILLRNWYERYVIPSIHDLMPEEPSYHAGRKELIIELIQQLHEPEDINHITLAKNNISTIFED